MNWQRPACPTAFDSISSTDGINSLGVSTIHRDEPGVAEISEISITEGNHDRVYSVPLESSNISKIIIGICALFSTCWHRTSAHYFEAGIPVVTSLRPRELYCSRMPPPQEIRPLYIQRDLGAMRYLANNSTVRTMRKFRGAGYIQKGSAAIVARDPAWEGYCANAIFAQRIMDPTPVQEGP